MSLTVMPEPAADGRFGAFGGRYVPEALIPACRNLEREFRDAWSDLAFRADLTRTLQLYAGRPTPVTPAARLSAELGINLLLKREDLAHTGSHKINNVLGQAAPRCWPRPGPGSTAWPPRPSAPCSGSTSPCSWGPRTSNARN
jgi:tryptophan synthase beta chain